MRLRVGVLWRGGSTSQDHISRLFRNHNDWCISVATYNSGHDRCVDDPKVFNTVHAQLVVDNRHFVSTHPRCSYRVVMRLRELSDMDRSPGVPCPRVLD